MIGASTLGTRNCGCSRRNRRHPTARFVAPARPRPSAVVPRRLLAKPCLPTVEQSDAGLRCQVERGPVVRRQIDVRHTRGAKRDGKGLQCECEPQRLVVRERAAGRQMAKRAVDPRRIVRVAEHARQLQPDLDLQVHRHRRCIFADVVRVVGQGEDLCGQAGDQQIGNHMTEIARTVERYRFLQRRR